MKHLLCTGCSLDFLEIKNSDRLSGRCQTLRDNIEPLSMTASQAEKSAESLAWEFKEVIIFQPRQIIKAPRWSTWNRPWDIRDGH